ncbi:MAG TPA: type II secretion system protein [Candidatus Paceibacterota bacterium]|nr:type II secretion system protein [Candidatus Paceibacterota bacterium]HMO83211.1 type II secretion system protein [Candidatus Paceibacterota bacterium]
MVSQTYSQRQGFTLIEMIVSLGIFSIVVTTAVGAMLILISTNRQLQSEQSVMTNLSFALDTMTREIRTGYNYYCANDASSPSGFFTGNGHEDIGPDVQDCPSGRGNTSQQGVSFYEGGNSLTGATTNRVLYYFDNNTKSLYRRLGNGSPQSIVSSGLSIIDAQFYVTGAYSVGAVPANYEQPTVTIYLAAQDANDASRTYYLQTTVTQRILDI